MHDRVTQRPTKSQLVFCEVLGIQVSDTDTSLSVSKKIGRVKGEVATKLFRESGVKPGHIVRKNYFGGDPDLCVLLKIGIDKVCVKRLDNGRIELFNTIDYHKGKPPLLTITDVFPPPQNWQHASTVTLEGGRIDVEYEPRLRSWFLRYVKKELAQQERQTLEYGEYWRIDAVDRLRGRFLEKNDL